jgi:hypothetical protein
MAKSSIKRHNSAKWWQVETTSGKNQHNIMASRQKTSQQRQELGILFSPPLFPTPIQSRHPPSPPPLFPRFSKPSNREEKGSQIHHRKGSAAREEIEKGGEKVRRKFLPARGSSVP